MWVFFSICPFVLVLVWFWLHRVARGILVPQPGMEPASPALGARSLNHWTTREVPRMCVFGARVFEEVIKVRWGREGGPKSEVTGLLRKRDQDTDTLKGKTMQKPREKPLQARERGLRRSRTCQHPDLGLQPPEEINVCVEATCPQPSVWGPEQTNASSHFSSGWASFPSSQILFHLLLQPPRSGLPPEARSHHIPVRTPHSLPARRRAFSSEKQALEPLVETE